jgi:DNA modification methylase
MTQPQRFLDGRVMLHAGDCLKVLRRMEPNSVDAVVCDPPYHIASIVKRFGADNAKPAKDGATAAFHRQSRKFVGKTWDAGDIAFKPAVWREVLRVLKPGGYIFAFAFGRTYHRLAVAIEDAGFVTLHPHTWIFGGGMPMPHRVRAQGYEGMAYGAASLKPASEPIYWGQKPFSEHNGTNNVQLWGTGAVNIEACRIPGELDQGRWPANVHHDGSAAVLGQFPLDDDDMTTARFFYCAKADDEDRLGLDHPTIKPVRLMQWLVRLVTPKGGVVLDPFAGTGTTAEAAFREGMRAILIEKDPSAREAIAHRMGLADNPTRREAVAVSHGELHGAEGTPLFQREAAE